MRLIGLMPWNPMKFDSTTIKFDYNYHITLKEIIGREYRYFKEAGFIFRGIQKNRCAHCSVEGLEQKGIPFILTDLNTEITRCFLKRMGLKEITQSEYEILPELYEDSFGELICKQCETELEYNEN